MNTPQSTLVTQGTVPSKRHDLQCHLLDGEAIVYDVAHNAVHYLNTTAYFIWNCCDGHQSIRNIAIKLANAFDWQNDHEDPQATMLNDVRHTLDKLTDDGLIEWDSPKHS